MKTERSRSGLLFLFLIFLGWVTACESLTPAPSAQSPEAIYTAAAETMAFDLTLSAGRTAVAQLTEIASRTEPTIPPTPLPALANATPSPPAVTPLPPTATLIALTCDAARFVGDVTVQANATISPGEGFVKTWRIRNVGSCTWTPAYTLVFSGGDAMGGPSLFSLPDDVVPGDMIDISIQLTSPSVGGNYQGYWTLHTPSGSVIRITPEPFGALWVQIQVQPPPTSRGSYDFAASYCDARWRSKVASLPCPGDSADTRGSVLLLANPDLESRKENEPALWLRPAKGQNGWISGEYPPFFVREGDQFVSEIGCLNDNPDCDLDFELDYQAMNGEIVSLGSWSESYDGETTNIDLDLSGVAGETVQFILRVTNRGAYKDANAFWFVPHIQATSPSNELVLSWHNEGGVNKSCSDVKVYLTGRRSGEARARNCKSGSQASGSLALSNDQVDQIRKWVDKFNSFEFGAKTPTTGETIDEKIVFNGEGKTSAAYDDILQMQDFMRNLYNAIIF